MPPFDALTDNTRHYTIGISCLSCALLQSCKSTSSYVYSNNQLNCKNVNLLWGERKTTASAIDDCPVELVFYILGIKLPSHLLEMRGNRLPFRGRRRPCVGCLSFDHESRVCWDGTSSNHTHHYHPQQWLQRCILR